VILLATREIRFLIAFAPPKDERKIVGMINLGVVGMTAKLSADDDDDREKDRERQGWASANSSNCPKPPSAGIRSPR
jgi:hypothetical protein